MLEQILSFFIPNAYAEMPIAPGSQGGGYSFIMIFVVFFIFIYFAVWRPQNKRAKEQRDLLNSIAKGDEVLTIGGMLGRITKINDQYIVVSVANNVEIAMQKSAVANVLPKGTIKTIE